MFFVPVIRRSTFLPSLRTFDRFFNDAAPAEQASSTPAEDKTYELTFDVPGVSREQLNIGIEGNIIRLETVADAPRQYKAAYELPQDIDVAQSEAKLENGVLTLKLAKVEPMSRATKLQIN